MIQFNLLPTVKLEYIKVRRLRRLITLISLAVSGVALIVLLLAAVTVYVVQKKSLHDLSSDLTTYNRQLNNIPGLDKILTVQNQLDTLTTLHDQKAVASRLFGYISQVTPAAVSISNLDVDFGANTMSINGKATALNDVNSFTDTLKATTYQVSGSGNTKAFSSVVLSAFSRTDTEASYTITLSFDPTIFNSADNVKLQVPNQVNTSTTPLFSK